MMDETKYQLQNNSKIFFCTNFYPTCSIGCIYLLIIFSITQIASFNNSFEIAFYLFENGLHLFENELKFFFKLKLRLLQLVFSFLKSNFNFLNLVFNFLKLGLKRCSCYLLVHSV